MLVSFSPATGHTLPDRYIEGTCPICGYPEARGDQCDNCGNQLDPTDLIEPRSRIDGSVPEFRETKHLFLDLPQFADRLRSWISSPRRLAPERQELLARAARRDPAAADHPRPRLGRADPGPRLRRGRAEADLRLVRRGDRLSLGVDRMGRAARRAGRLARVVAEPRLGALLLPGQGQHRLPHRHLAGDAARLRGGRRVRRRPRHARSCRATSSRPSS